MFHFKIRYRFFDKQSKSLWEKCEGKSLCPNSILSVTGWVCCKWSVKEMATLIQHSLLETSHCTPLTEKWLSSNKLMLYDKSSCLCKRIICQVQRVNKKQRVIMINYYFHNCISVKKIRILQILSSRSCIIKITRQVWSIML